MSGDSAVAVSSVVSSAVAVESAKAVSGRNVDSAATDDVDLRIHSRREGWVSKGFILLDDCNNISSSISGIKSLLIKSSSVLCPLIVLVLVVVVVIFCFNDRLDVGLKASFVQNKVTNVIHWKNMLMVVAANMFLSTMDTYSRQCK